MTPNIIHYCWFGNKPLPKQALECLESWKKFLPGHSIILWNEENSPMHDPYLRNAHNLGNWANLSNYMRLYCLNEFGGWYFDTDVELLKFPDLSSYNESCFLGIESNWWEDDIMVNNAIIASSKGHHFIEFSLAYLKSNFDGSEKANLSSPILTTDLLKEFGFKGKPGIYSDIRIFPKDIFYPSSYFDLDHRSKISDNSISIHYYDSNWLNFESMTSSEIRNLYKNMIYYKKSFQKIKLGKISFKEWLGITLRFFRLI